MIVRPTSSNVSRSAVAASLMSSGSRFPPGRAMWDVQRSVRRAARFMNRISGWPDWTHGCEKVWVRWSVKERSGDDAGLLM